MELDDDTLSAYMEQLRRQLNKLERFREVSFGPHSVARHQSEPHVSWFFRRRSLPSLSDSEQANALHEPLRSVQSLKFRTRLGKSTSPRKLNESHDSRATYPLTGKRRRNSESTRLPPIRRNGNSGPSTGSSGAPKVPPKNRSVQSLKFRTRLGKSTSPRKLNESHDSRATYPLTGKRRRNSESTRLPPIRRNGNSGPSTGSSGAPKVPPKNRTVSSKRRSNSRKRDEPVRMQKIKPKDQATDTLPTLAVVGVSALAGGASAVAAAALSSSMNPVTPLTIPQLTELPSEQLQQPEGDIKKEPVVTGEEELSGDQNDEQLPSSTPLLAEGESAVETANSISDAEGREEETKLGGSEQQQKTSEEQIVVQEKYDAQNDEESEKQFDTEAVELEAVKESYDAQNETSDKQLDNEVFESEAVKAESSPQGAPLSMRDQSETVFGDQAVEGEEGKIEVKPQQLLELSIETSEMQSESAFLESEMHKVERQLQGKPLQGVSHQPLMESPDMKSEQLEEQPHSPDERDSAEKQYSRVHEETEGYSSAHKDSIVAKDAESNYDGNIGGTTPTALLELSHEDEKGGGIVLISQANADQKKVKETESIEEQQVEHEEILKAESVTPPTEGLSEVTDKPEATVEAQATLTETFVDEKLYEQNDNQDIGRISEHSEEQQTCEEAEPNTEPATINGGTDNAQVQNGSARSVDSNETQEISYDSGATEGPGKEKEADQISRGSLNNDSLQGELISSPAPDESAAEVQEPKDEQSAEARPTAASPASLGTTEDITRPVQTGSADMAQQSTIDEETNKVEDAPDGMSWEMKGGNRNGSDDDVQEHLENAADIETVQHSEICACKSESDTENAVYAVTSEVCEDGLSVGDGQAESDVYVTETSEVRRKRSASFEEHTTDVSEQLPAGVTGGEANSPEPVSGAEQPSADTEASSQCLTSRSNETTAEKDSCAGENSGVPGAFEASESEETPGERSPKADDTNAATQGEEKSQIEAIGSNEKETSEASKKADEEVEESTKQAESEPNLSIECRNGKDTAEAETNSAGATADTCQCSPELRSDDVEEKQQISENETQITDALADSRDQVSCHSVQRSEVTAGECDNYPVDGDQEVPPIAASEETSQLGIESSHVEGDADVDHELCVEKTQGGVASETSSEGESQKERNPFDENANHPDTVNGEQSQQILGNKTNGNITHKSDDEKMQRNEQPSSPLQKPSSKFFEGSDGDSQDVRGGEDETEVATLMHQTTEAEHQTSV
uniref:Serine/arginine repetitive matrix protein 2-like n=1 Tax=Ascaris lumbricoides TaxID=6252 RepID=A0A0M3IQY9_ASCLU